MVGIPVPGRGFAPYLAVFRLICNPCLEGGIPTGFSRDHSACLQASFANGKLLIVERFVEEHPAGLFRKSDQSLQLMDVLG